MKFSAAAVVLSSSILGATALQSLSQFVENIPSCSYSAFAGAVKKAGCSTTDVNSADFDCICNHTGDIVVDTTKNLPSSCIADFANGLGGLCGMWEVQGTAATDLAAATSLLAQEFGGKAPGGSKPTATGSSASGATAGTKPSATAAGGSSSSSKGGAGMPTAAPGVVGLAAVALAGLII